MGSSIVLALTQHAVANIRCEGMGGGGQKHKCVWGVGGNEGALFVYFTTTMPEFHCCPADWCNWFTAGNESMSGRQRPVQQPSHSHPSVPLLSSLLLPQIRYTLYWINPLLMPQKPQLSIIAVMWTLECSLAHRHTRLCRRPLTPQIMSSVGPSQGFTSPGYPGYGQWIHTTCHELLRPKLGTVVWLMVILELS